MKAVVKVLTLLLVLTIGFCGASAESYVSVVELREQTQAGWNGDMLVVPDVDHLPVISVEKEKPVTIVSGTFDENESGSFCQSVRYGSTPPRTELKNGLKLSDAEMLLENELNNRFGKSLSEYDLLWTEIAEWKNMETWLLYYGQKFHNVTCFNIGITMDARTETYRHIVAEGCQKADVVYTDVPLAEWSKIQQIVDKFLQKRSSAENKVLELGYLLQEDKGLLIPVWHLSYITSTGYKEAYFNAQNGETVTYWKGNYQFPELVVWD